MAPPWSAGRGVVLIDRDGKDRSEVMRDHFLLDEPGALQWHELATLWMLGTPANPFGGMSFASCRILHLYDLRTPHHNTSAASPVTQRMPTLTGSGSSFLVPLAGTVASPAADQFRHTWHLQQLKLVQIP